MDGILSGLSEARPRHGNVRGAWHPNRLSIYWDCETPPSHQVVSFSFQQVERIKNQSNNRRLRKYYNGKTLWTRK